MSPNRYSKSYDSFENEPEAHGKKGVVYGLLKDIAMAGKISQAAKLADLSTHNFDRAETLLACAKDCAPKLLILDWDACEAEAFKVLNEMRKNADLKGVTNVGYLSGSKTVLVEEARRAGCHRVYQKTEFLRELTLLTARCAA